MARLWTSDLHLGHRNIINYENRPFRSNPHNPHTAGEPDVDAMNEAIINMLADICTAGDELWLLGDLSLGRPERHLGQLRTLVERGVELVIVAGNHDLCHPGNRRNTADSATRYQQATGARRIYTNGTRTAIDGFGEVEVNHFPYRGESSPGRVDRYVSYRPVDRGRFLLHGHVHGTWAMSGRQINVGLDGWGGQVLTETDICSLLHAGPASIEAVPWPEECIPAVRSQPEDGIDAGSSTPSQHRFAQPNEASSAPTAGATTAAERDQQRPVVAADTDTRPSGHPRRAG